MAYTGHGRFKDTRDMTDLRIHDCFKEVTLTHAHTHAHMHNRFKERERPHADIENTLQHTATHCNTLQHTATHCNTLQHTATHCNTL